MSAASVNHLETGHRDEPGDCAMVALAVYLGLPYTDVLRAVAALDQQQGKAGLKRRTIQRVGAALGVPLSIRSKFTPQDYGIIVSLDHAAVLRSGLVLDRLAVWDWPHWLRKQKCKASDCVLLMARE